MNFYGQRKLEFCLKIFVLLSLAGVTSHCKSRELGESSAKSKGLADNSDLFEVIFEKDVGQFDSYVEKHISIDQVSQKAASIISSDCGRYNYADPGRNRLPYNPAKTDINGDAESGMSANRVVFTADKAKALYDTVPIEALDILLSSPDFDFLDKMMQYRASVIASAQACQNIVIQARQAIVKKSRHPQDAALVERLMPNFNANKIYLAQNNSELMATILLKVYQSSDGTVSEAQVKDKVQRLGIESAYDEVVSNTKSPKTDGEEFLHRRKVIGERRALSTMAHIKEYDIQKIVKRLTQGHD